MESMYNILMKEFIIPGTPKDCAWHCITRSDYESLPASMIAWNWTDEQMQELADEISLDFGYEVLSKELRDADCYDEEEITECIDDEFWKSMENCAVRLGMQYYEDLTDEEYRKNEIDFDNYDLGYNFRSAYVTIRIDYSYPKKYENTGEDELNEEVAREFLNAAKVGYCGEFKVNYAEFCGVNS